MSEEFKVNETLAVEVVEGGKLRIVRKGGGLIVIGLQEATALVSALTASASKLASAMADGDKLEVAKKTIWDVLVDVACTVSILLARERAIAVVYILKLLDHDEIEGVNEFLVFIRRELDYRLRHGEWKDGNS